MLARGGSVPFFGITTVEGAAVRYRDLWQLRNLLLVVIPPDHPSSADYRSALNACLPELIAHDTVLLITSDSIPGMPTPGALVADRWGEIYFVTPTLPPPSELLEWVRYVQYQCPECQGEAR